jgi:hypothetical protein
MPVHPVIHPGGSTDNAIVRHDGETGKRLQNGQSTEDDSGNVAIVGTLSVGTGHTVSGTLASVAGGSTNTNAADYGFLGGGQNCSIASGSDHSVLVGGNNNDITSTGDDNFIGGGNANKINTALTTSATVVGGASNTTSGDYSFIGGGQLCSIADGADHSVIVGGNNNDITGTGDDCFIGGGNAIQITGNGGQNVAVGGYANTISATGQFNFIGSGWGNDITINAYNAVLVGGKDNDNAASYAFLGGGELCSIASGADHSVVVGGYNNDITGTGDDCVISGGNGNQIDSNALSATITGGTGNVASAAYSEASGYQAATRALRGAVANANGQVTAVGDRQTRSVVMRRQTTTDTFLSLTADGGADSVSDTFQQPENSLASLTWTVIGLQSTGAKAAQYTVKALVKRYTATTSILLNSVTADFEDDATWDCQVIAYSLGATVQAKGASGETVNWCAKLESVEVVN